MNNAAKNIMIGVLIGVLGTAVTFQVTFASSISRNETAITSVNDKFETYKQSHQQWSEEVLKRIEARLDELQADAKANNKTLQELASEVRVMRALVERKATP